jgi:hypothetical protein
MPWSLEHRCPGQREHTGDGCHGPSNVDVRGDASIGTPGSSIICVRDNASDGTLGTRRADVRGDASIGTPGTSNIGVRDNVSDGILGTRRTRSPVNRVPRYFGVRAVRRRPRPTRGFRGIFRGFRANEGVRRAGQGRGAVRRPSTPSPSRSSEGRSRRRRTVEPGRTYSSLGAQPAVSLADPWASPRAFGDAEPARPPIRRRRGVDRAGQLGGGDLWRRDHDRLGVADAPGFRRIDSGARSRRGRGTWRHQDVDNTAYGWTPTPTLRYGGLGRSVCGSSATPPHSADRVLLRGCTRRHNRRRAARIGVLVTCSGHTGPEGLQKMSRSIQGCRQWRRPQPVVSRPGVAWLIGIPRQ